VCERYLLSFTGLKILLRKLNKQQLVPDSSILSKIGVFQIGLACVAASLSPNQGATKTLTDVQDKVLKYLKKYILVKPRLYKGLARLTEL